jgi:hypothetical protein
MVHIKPPSSLSSLPSHNSLPSPPLMPCVIQPGGEGGKIGVRYTTRRKHGILASAKRLMAEGMTLRKAMAELRVNHSSLVKWTAKRIGNIDSLDKITNCTVRRWTTTSSFNTSFPHISCSSHELPRQLICNPTISTRMSGGWTG